MLAFPALLLAPLGRLLFTAFTLAPLLFTLTLDALTGLPFGPLPRLGTVLFLASDALVVFTLFTSKRGFMLALFTGEHRFVLALLTGTALSPLPRLGPGLFAGLLLGLLAGVQVVHGGGDGPPVGEPGLRGDDEQQRGDGVDSHANQVFLQGGVGYVQGQGHDAGHPAQRDGPPPTTAAQTGQGGVQADDDDDGRVHDQRQNRGRPLPLLGGVTSRERGDRQNRVQHRSGDDQPRPDGQSPVR